MENVLIHMMADCPELPLQGVLHGVTPGRALGKRARLHSCNVGMKCEQSFMSEKQLRDNFKTSRLGVINE